MGLWKTVRNPVFRMGLRRSMQIWRHNIPPYPALPPLDIDNILLPLPYRPSPFDSDGDWLTQNEFDDRVQAWGRKLEAVGRENDSRIWLGSGVCGSDCLSWFCSTCPLSHWWACWFFMRSGRLFATRRLT